MSDPNPAHTVIRVLRCPWCGGTARLQSYPSISGDHSIVECDAADAGCGGCGPWERSLERAVEQWNRVAARAGVLDHDPA